MTGEIRLSHSALHTMSQCGERYRLRYVEKMRGFGSYRMIVGTAVHKAGAEAHARVLKARNDGADFRGAIADALPFANEMSEIADQTFQAEEATGVVMTNDEKAVGQDTVREQQRGRARSGAATYLVHVAQRVDPLAVERKFEIRPKGMGVVLSGVVDLVGRELGGGKAILDTKVSSKRPNRDAAETSLQLTLYYMFETIATGVAPERVGLNYIVQPDGRPGSHVPLSTSRNGDNVRAAVARIGAAEQAIRAGVYVPANTDQWTCSEKFCEFWPVCKFAHRR